jgi:hypothetical protein
MSSRVRAALFGALALTALGCGKDRSQGQPGRDQPAVTAPQGPDCGHTACGSNFFIDSAQNGACAAGANCSLVLTLVATGDFHINDEYPYKFRADDAQGVTFLGTDAAGPSVFSKAANNWQKTAPQTGVMTVGFQPAPKGSGQKSISGNFKLSVCSAANCQLEQQTVSTAITVH